MSERYFVDESNESVVDFGRVIAIEETADEEYTIVFEGGAVVEDFCVEGGGLIEAYMKYIGLSATRSSSNKDRKEL